VVLGRQLRDVTSAVRAGGDQKKEMVRLGGEKIHQENVNK